MPRKEKLSLGEFEKKYQEAEPYDENISSSSDLVNQRRITTEQVENMRSNQDYGRSYGDDRYGGERRGGYGDRGDRYGSSDRYGGDRYGGERRGGYDREPREPVPVPDEPPYRAFVRNLPRECIEDDVADFFREQEVEEISLPRALDGRNKGFCFITFKNREDLALLVEEGGLDIGDGHELRIEVSNTKKPERRGGDRYGGDRYGERGGGRYGSDRRYGDEDEEGPRSSVADTDDNWRRAKPTGGSRRGTRAPPRGDRPERFGGERGGDRFGGERRGERFGGERGGDRYGGERGGDRYGGERGGSRGFGGDRGGDRYGGEREGGRGFGGERGAPRGGGRFGGFRSGGRFSENATPVVEKEDPSAIYLSAGNPFGESKPVAPKEEKTEETNQE